jgi:O-antigen ligase
MAMIGLAALIAFPFLYTLSRASYIGIIFSYLTLIILSKKKTALIGMMVTVVLLVAILRPEAVFSRVEYTFQEKEQTLAKIGNIYLDQSSTERVRSWGDSFKAWKKNPILGRGVTSFGFIDGQYVLILPELGIVGLLTFFWLLWLIFNHSLKTYKKMADPLYKGLALGFFSSAVGLAVHALTANTFIIIRIMEPFWFIAAIVMMLPELTEEESEKEG